MVTSWYGVTTQESQDDVQMTTGPPIHLIDDSSDGDNEDLEVSANNLGTVRTRALVRSLAMSDYKLVNVPLNE